MKFSALFCPFAQFFRNPHHLSGVILSRILVNMATLIWAGIILANKDTLSRSGSRYAFVTKYVHEDVLAASFGLLAIAQLYALWSHKAPITRWGCGYMILCLAWTFVFAYNILEPGPIYATATSLSATVAFAAFYAFLDGSDRKRGKQNAMGR